MEQASKGTEVVRVELCGVGGIIRDAVGNIKIAFSIYLGQGTSNWAECQAMQIGLQLSRVYNTNVQVVEADSQLLTMR